MKPVKKLCGLKKDKIKDNLDEVIEIVADAKYICCKCARVSKSKKHLCKPKAMDLATCEKKKE